jgi:Pentacotripeptide-repeat region of PRORP
VTLMKYALMITLLLCWAGVVHLFLPCAAVCSRQCSVGSKFLAEAEEPARRRVDQGSRKSCKEADNQENFGYQAIRPQSPQSARRRPLSRHGIGTSNKQNDFDALLGRFNNATAINEWMKELVVQQRRSSDAGALFSTSSSSRDETNFLRCLRDRGAYPALELFACHLARKNVYIYTAAISAMARCPERRIRKRGLAILDHMDEDSILPSSFTFGALFQSTDGPEEARKMMARLQKYRAKTAWSVESFNQAILACARKEPQQQHSTNKSWQVALEFAFFLRKEGLSPNLQTFTNLLVVCAATGQFRIAMSILREMEGTPGIVADAKVWSLLMQVCAQAGAYIQANEVLKTMQKQGHTINLAHCSALLKALARHGKVGISLKVLHMMTKTTTLSSEVPSDVNRFPLVRLPLIAPDLVGKAAIKCIRMLVVRCVSNNCLAMSYISAQYNPWWLLQIV